MTTHYLTLKDRTELERLTTDAALASRRAYRREYGAVPVEGEIDDADSYAWADDYKAALNAAGVDHAPAQADYDRMLAVWRAAFFLPPVYQTDDLTIQADANGILYMSNNALSDERIDRRMYAVWSAEDLARMREELIAEGMPREIADRIERQASGLREDD
jgi:hypothetical protein